LMYTLCLWRKSITKYTAYSLSWNFNSCSEDVTSILLWSLKTCTHIARTTREVASRGKTREIDICLAPALASYGGSRGARQRQSVFWRAQRCLALTGLPCMSYSKWTTKSVDF
jgi:hypothetical protein